MFMLFHFNLFTLNNEFQCFSLTKTTKTQKIAFGMNIDSINGKDLTFNDSITSVLFGTVKKFEDPFIEINPLKWSYINDLKVKMRYLRSIGKEKILEHIKNYADLKTSTKEIEANDILSAILKSYGETFEYFCLFKFICFQNRNIPYYCDNIYIYIIYLHIL